MAFCEKIILSCINSGAASLSQTQQSHAYLVKSALFNQTHLTTKLLSLYAKNLCFSDANLLLNSIAKPHIYSFSTLIYALSKSGRFSHVLNLFAKMLSHGLLPDSHLLPCTIKACSALSAFKAGQQLHGFGLISGLSSDAFVQSSFIHFYVKCNKLSYAHKVFDKMPEQDVVSLSALIAGYARQGNVVEVNRMFENMGSLGIEPNSVTWNGVIAGFNQSGHYTEAVSMFKKMHFLGFMLDGTNISSVLSAVGDVENFKLGVQVHGYAVKQCLGLDKCVLSALIDMYGKCSCTSDMSKVFDEMEKMDIGACNAYLAGLSRNGLMEEVLRVFKQFQSEEIELNVVSWTSMIACCSQHGKDLEALELFREMQVKKVKPNAVTIPCLLPACGNIAALLHGKAAHCFSIRNRILNDVYVGSALIDMYSNCGKIEAARLCFDRMPVRNLVCWNAMISGYAMFGNSNEVVKMFDLMQKSQLKPDFITFTSLLSACSHSGLTEMGQKYFNMMLREYNIEPQIEHYACMVTLLGRAGKLEEAYNLIEQMPFKPDACVWGALLSSCRVHHNLNLAEIAANKLFTLEPSNSGNYILLANIYASKGKWHEVDKVRDKMQRIGLRKNPGCSWIEIKNKVHLLLAGDKSHPQMDEIKEKIKKLNIEMKKLGYSPITSFVLQDVEDEEDKENILCGHSEKLAVVLGLLNTPPNSPLRVMKNLRICGDCHAVIKFVSGFESREIFVRDTNRFHHFKDGICSCGDFW